MTFPIRITGICILLLFAQTVHAKTNHSEVDDLIRLDKQWTAAEVRGDRRAVEHIIARDFVMTTEDGDVKDRAAYLDEVHAPTATNSYNETADDYRVRIYGTAAVMTHRGHIAEHADGATKESTIRATHVWAKLHGQWQLVATHFSFLTAKP